MKEELIEWAIDAETRTASMKLVLMIMAGLADDDGVCIETKSTLAGYSGLSVQSIKNITRELAESGYIKKRAQFTQAGESLANAYELLVGALEG